MVNSKQKGASFERDVCRRLSLWVSNGKQEDCYWRSSMSGGRSTVAAKKGKRLAAQAGDISCIHPLGEPFAAKFLIECKHYANLELTQLCLNGKGKLAEFWKIVSKEADRCGKEPLLIAKQNRYPTIVCMKPYALIKATVSFQWEQYMAILPFDWFLEIDTDVLVSYL
jgi:hypothetical protein